MIVFAGIVPHSPLLIPSVGKEHRDRLAGTLAALKQMEEALYVARPETLAMLSPHAAMYPDAMSGNIHESFTGTIKAFGDHGTTVAAKADFLLLDHIHRHMRGQDVPFTLTSEEELDYGFTVPLLLLTSHLASWKLVPLSVSLQDAQAHYAYGRELQQVLQSETRRVAVIASADLSHHASDKSSQGMTEEGAQFDRDVRACVAKQDAKSLLALDPAMLEAAGQCGYRPIVTLMGILDGMNTQANELCYEAPFGVGYLTERFELG